MTLDALCWSSVAVLPQLFLTSREMDDVMLLKRSVLEQAHDCNSVSESPHIVPYVSVAMLYEMASETQGACEQEALR
jgi:hypothetical protein